MKKQLVKEKLMEIDKSIIQVERHIGETLADLKAKTKKLAVDWDHDRFFGSREVVKICVRLDVFDERLKRLNQFRAMLTD